MPTLVDYFDFVVVESCFQYEECDPYQQFIADNKAVLAIEYRRSRKYCKPAKAMGFSLIGKSPALKAPRTPCK